MGSCFCSLPCCFSFSSYCLSNRSLLHKWLRRCFNDIPSKSIVSPVMECLWKINPPATKASKSGRSESFFLACAAWAIRGSTSFPLAGPSVRFLGFVNDALCFVFFSFAECFFSAECIRERLAEPTDDEANLPVSFSLLIHFVPELVLCPTFGPVGT